MCIGMTNLNRDGICSFMSRLDALSTTQNPQIFDIPGVAGAVIKTALSLNH